MFVFNALAMVIWIIVANLFPGALLSLSLLKEREDLLLVEKLLIGFALGLIFPPLFMFLLVLFNIPYSFPLALFTTILFYLLSLALYLKKRPSLSLPKGMVNFPLREEAVISFSLLVLFLLSFWIRMQSFSPIFQELDPYYYLYTSYLFLTQGIPPVNDGTAWWPHPTTHRVKPLLALLEAEWYSFYTLGGEIDNYLLSAVANFYPPLAASLALFFLYLFLSTEYDRKYSLIAAFFASFVPIFLLKTLAGEFEIQPYAFFALSFFFAFYARAIKTRAPIYIFLASLGVFATILATSSIVVILSALIIYIPIRAIHLFMRGEKDYSSMLPDAAVFFSFLLAFSLAHTFLKGSWTFTLGGNSGIALLIVLAFEGFLLYVERNLHLPREKLSTYGVYFLFLLLVLFFLTPFGSIIKSIASNALRVAEYTLPLHRTIQEQGLTGRNFYGSLGFLGKPASPMLSPLFSPFTTLINALFHFAVNVTNILFDATLLYYDKDNMLLMPYLFFLFLAFLYGFYRKFARKEETLIVLFAAIVLPVTLVGIIKAKYTIYMGYFLAGGLAIILGETEKFVREFFPNLSKKRVINVLLAVGLLLTLFEGFVDRNAYAGALLFNSYKLRFQDNPSALQQKMQALCSFGIKKACEAAKDPIGYANKGINYQFDRDLCIWSLLSDPMNPDPMEAIAASIRCQRIAGYWIDAMEWICYNTPEGSRITSWWDYGHWINYFGLRNAVIRNEHSYHDMILDVAYAYIMGDEKELREVMKKYNSTYALFDVELIMPDGHFGGKFGALNYLACAEAGETDVSKAPGQSLCEFENMWEQVFVGNQECVVSPIKNKKGRVAYKLKVEETPLGLRTDLQPYYCLSTTKLATGEEIPALYYLDKKNAIGELKLNKGFLIYDGRTRDGLEVYSVFYTKDKVWLENGTVVDGWSDRKGRFYDSNLYKAFVLRELEGFRLVYSTPPDFQEGAVKIFEITR